MKRNRSLWPIAIIATFALFISATAGLIVLACSHKSDLVSADYYEQELAFQKRIEQVSRALEEPGLAGITYDAVKSVISISLPKAPLATTGRIQLYRPSAAGLDRIVALSLNHYGIQTIDTRALQAGLWRVRVSWSAEGHDFFIEQKVVLTVPQAITRNTET